MLQVLQKCFSIGEILSYDLAVSDVVFNKSAALGDDDRRPDAESVETFKAIHLKF